MGAFFCCPKIRKRGQRMPKTWESDAQSDESPITGPARTRHIVEPIEAGLCPECYLKGKESKIYWHHLGVGWCCRMRQVCGVCGWKGHEEWR